MSEEKPLLPEAPLGREYANKGSIILMILITFLSNVVFSIVLPSLPSYIGKVGGAAYLSGWAVAANSLGNFAFSPLFGWWADRRSVREVMVFSLLLEAGGNFWYAMAGDMYQLFASRFLVGVAAANGAPASAYLSYATSVESRTRIIGLTNVAAVIGFICGPAFSLVVSIPALQFNLTIPYINFTIVFNSMTGPGFISGIFALAALFPLIPFKEVKKPVTVSLSSNGADKGLPPISKIGVAACLFLNFAFVTAFTIFETIGPIYLNSDPYLKFDNFDTSLMFLCVSGIALLSLVSLQGLLLLKIDDRILLYIFGGVLISALVTMWDWSGGWISMARMFVAAGLLGLSFSNGEAMLSSIYSKMLEGHEQGAYFGYMGSAGAISRMTCPIGMGYGFNFISPNFIIMVTGILVLIAMTFAIISYKHIQPANVVVEGQVVVN